MAENIFFGRLPSRRGRVAWRRLHEEAAAALGQVGLEVDPRRQVRHLGIGEQQLVEVAQALTQSARVLILDEPTSALSPREIERLFALIRRLKQEGAAILYVSHKLEEILDLSDRVTVLRDGRLVRTAPVAELDGERLISLMAGRPSAPKRRRRRRQRRDRPRGAEPVDRPGARRQLPRPPRRDRRLFGADGGRPHRARPRRPGCRSAA